MISSGLIIIMGFVFIGVKLPRKTALRMLGHPLALDIAVSVLAYAVHWGTFSGVMAAAFAGMMCSIITWLARRMFGYIESNTFHPGFIHLEIK